jgi:hypothetical protein
MTKRKKKTQYRYDFEDVSVMYGGAECLVSGIATYEITNDGIGSYEYWGAEENNHEYIAEFISVVIESHRFVNPVEFPNSKTLNERDEESLKDIIIEQFNDDVPFCMEIANIKDEE